MDSIFDGDVTINERCDVNDEEMQMIEAFKEIDGPPDEAAADAEAAESVFKGLEMVRRKCAETVYSRSLCPIKFY